MRHFSVVILSVRRYKWKIQWWKKITENGSLHHEPGIIGIYPVIIQSWRINISRVTVNKSMYTVKRYIFDDT